jgi:hypothetical protein
MDLLHSRIFWSSPQYGDDGIPYLAWGATIAISLRQLSAFLSKDV